MSEESQATGNTQTTGGAQPGAVAGSTSEAGASAPASTVLTSEAPNSQQATDGQTAQGDKPQADNTQGEKAAQQGAPEKYEFKAPEGVTLDATVSDEFAAVAKELNLPQDAAQKVLDKMAPIIAKQNAQAITAAMEKATNDWREAITSDKEIGGDKLNENLVVAKKAVERFGSAELRALLGRFDAANNPKGLGLGDHPEVIKMFHRIGKAISEDKFVPGGTAPPNSGPRNLAAALYPKQA